MCIKKRFQYLETRSTILKMSSNWNRFRAARPLLMYFCFPLCSLLLYNSFTWKGLLRGLFINYANGMECCRKVKQSLLFLPEAMYFDFFQRVTCSAAFSSLFPTHSPCVSYLNCPCFLFFLTLSFECFFFFPPSVCLIDVTCCIAAHTTYIWQQWPVQ